MTRKCRSGSHPSAENGTLKNCSLPERGFTLIEVLVALTVLSLSLGIIFSLFSAGLGGKRTAEDYEQATLFAESKLNSLGVDEPIQLGNTFGSFNDRFTWSAVVTPYVEKGRDDTKDLLRQPLVVTVTVSWKDSANQRSISLTTLRLIPRR
jgi:general secretion pathway protein I